MYDDGLSFVSFEQCGPFSHFGINGYHGPEDYSLFDEKHTNMLFSWNKFIASCNVVSTFLLLGSKYYQSKTYDLLIIIENFILDL